MEKRYERNIGTLTSDGQKLINSKSALVIGSGGLGGFVIEGLARMGFMKIGVCDFDRFTESNLNRQLLSTEEFLGKLKVDVAKERINKIDKRIVVNTYSESFPNDKVVNDFEGYDIIFDCLDSIDTRLYLEKYCAERNKVLIHGAVGGYYGTVAVITNENLINNKLMQASPKIEDTIDKIMGNPFPIVSIVGAFQVHLALNYLTGMSYLKKGFYYIDIQNFIIEEIVL